MAAPISVVHFTDPGCPWAYSASPDLAVLHWRYGDQLAWRLAMIGLTEDAQVYLDRGYTPERMAKSNRAFRRFGMPIATAPRPRVSSTSPACRTIVAARLAAPEREYEVFRALQWAQFTSPAVFDEPDDLRAAVAHVEGVDADAIVGAIDEPQVWEAYERDRVETRTAEGGPTQAQGKSANSDGAERFTAPSLLMTRESDGFTLEAGGFQPLEAYDVCLANLDPTLTRRAPATDVGDVLAAFDYPLATQEVAAVMAAPLAGADSAAAEDALISACAAGTVRREALGDDALWRLA